MKRLACLLAGLLALAASGCLAVAHRPSAWRAPTVTYGEVSDVIVAGLVDDGDKAWAQREKPRQLDEAMRAYRAALHQRPTDAGIMVHLGRIAYRRGQQYDGKSAALHFADAAAWAERALTARNPALAEAALGGKPPADVFHLAQPADEDALVLYAESVLWWAIANNTTTVIEQKSWIEAAAARALVLDRGAGYGAPDRVLAVLACELPAARQNLRDALDHFEAAVAAAPAFLPTRLLYAEEYAVRLREAPLFRHLLQAVVSGDAHALVEALPENLEAQREAQKLLRRLQ
jgi:tetratricopeptide (TPR) repeat protein